MFVFPAVLYSSLIRPRLDVTLVPIPSVDDSIRVCVPRASSCKTINRCLFCFCVCLLSFCFSVCFCFFVFCFFCLLLLLLEVYQSPRCPAAYVDDVAPSPDSRCYFLFKLARCVILVIYLCKDLQGSVSADFQACAIYPSEGLLRPLQLPPITTQH